MVGTSFVACREECCHSNQPPPPPVAVYNPVLKSVVMGGDHMHVLRKRTRYVRTSSLLTCHLFLMPHPHPSHFPGRLYVSLCTRTTPLWHQSGTAVASSRSLQCAKDL